MGVRNKPLINGQAYAFTQLRLIVQGVRIRGVTSINYTEGKTKTNEYGAGEYPIERGEGQIEPDASIELSQTAVEKLRKLSPTGKLIDLLPFTILVSFRNRDGRMVDLLKNAEFLDYGVDSSTGDTRNTRDFPLIFSHLESPTSGDRV